MISFSVNDMTCAHCVSSITKAVNGVDQGARVNIDLATHRVAPELNPRERVWDELRGKEFPNRVNADMASVRAQLEGGLSRLAADAKALRSLTAWPWIASLGLIANGNKQLNFSNS
jgi:copper chaperone CopZ